MVRPTDHSGTSGERFPPQDDLPTVLVEDLKEYGVPWRRKRVMRLVREGRFPQPYRWSPRVPAWSPRQIENYVMTVMGRAPS